MRDEFDTSNSFLKTSWVRLVMYSTIDDYFVFATISASFEEPMFLNKDFLKENF
jgi:hypothetical protein